MIKTQSIDVRVYYEDTDAGGVVYYANYLKYCERGRTEFLRQLGFNQEELMQQNRVFAVRKASISYNSPARLDDKLQVITEIEKLKKASISFKHTILKEQSIVCQAQVLVACLNAQKFTPVAIPSSIMSQLTHEWIRFNIKPYCRGKSPCSTRHAHTAVIVSIFMGNDVR